MTNQLGKIVGGLLIGCTAFSTVSAQETVVEPDSTAPAEWVTDDPWVARMDSLIRAPYFEAFALETDTQTLNVHDYPLDSVPEFSEAVIAERLQVLNDQSPFDLTYNDRVAAFIRLYANRRRELTGKFMGLSSIYFPMFEEELDRQNMPLEIKYLAVVESALNPTARSRVGATGLWQFMYHTGKLYGLKINSYIDERRDPQRSTEAACAYLNYLHGLFDDWNLALAAYNCGEGRVMRAIRRSGGKRDYWELYPYLPRETRGYVPAFIAVNYLMNHASDHNIYPLEPTTGFFEIDTIRVKEAMSLKRMAEVLQVPQENLEYLNPIYRNKYVPKSKDGMLVRVPYQSVAHWENNEDSIYAMQAVKKDEPVVVEEVRKTHIVRRGEYLGKIANQHRVSVGQIRQWNGLRSSRINPGQRLIIYTNPAAAPIAKRQPIRTEKEGNYEYYKIQKGDTLWDIAKAKGISINELKNLNRNLNYRNLKPGERIIVGTSG